MPRSWEQARVPREPIKPGEKLWVHIAYRKQDDGKIACQLTSNIPLERGMDFYDIKSTQAMKDESMSSSKSRQKERYTSMCMAMVERVPA